MNVLEETIKLRETAKPKKGYTFLYTLADPTDRRVRYIGKTNNPVQRAHAHNNPARDKSTHKRNWIMSLRKIGLKPIFEILEEVPINNWQYWESYWIQQFTVWGFSLVNCTSGGDGLSYGNQTSFKPGNGARRVVELSIQGEVLNTYSMVKKSPGKGFSVDKLGSYTKSGSILLYEDTFSTMSPEGITDYISKGKDLAELNRKAHYEVCINKSGFKKGFKPWNSGVSGYSLPTKGRKRDPEIIKKIAAKRKGQSNPGRWRSVDQIDVQTNLKINTFPSIKKAMADTGVKGIANCVSGGSKTSGGYIWRYSV